MKRLIRAVLFFGILLALWYFGQERLPKSYKLLLPDPLAVGSYLWHAHADLITGIGVTMRRLIGTIMHTLFNVPELRLRPDATTGVAKLITESEPIRQLIG